MTGRFLSTWVVYDHPRDIPDKWVVRRWDLVRGIPEPQWSPVCFTADTLEAARELIPPGLTCLQRSEDDDPCIMEVWL